MSHPGGAKWPSAKKRLTCVLGDEGMPGTEHWLLCVPRRVDLYLAYPGLLPGPTYGPGPHRSDS